MYLPLGLGDGKIIKRGGCPDNPGGIAMILLRQAVAAIGARILARINQLF